MFGLLLLLMGIVPLSVWGTSTARNLGKEIWKPAAFSLVFAVAGCGFRRAPVDRGAGILACGARGLYHPLRLCQVSQNQLGEQQRNLWKSFVRLTTRNRRRYGGYIIHLGIVLMALGIIGIEFFQTQTQATIKPGETLNLSGYSFTYKDLQVEDTAEGMNVATSTIQISRGDRDLGTVYPRRDYYYESQQAVTIPGLRSTLKDDLYVILVDWMPITSDGATFKIFRNPLVIWLWIGSIVLALGTARGALARAGKKNRFAERFRNKHENPEKWSRFPSGNHLPRGNLFPGACPG